MAQDGQAMLDELDGIDDGDEVVLESEDGGAKAPADDGLEVVIEDEPAAEEPTDPEEVPDPEPIEEAGEAEPVDDDAGYSKKVRARIDREQRLRRETEERLEEERRARADAETGRRAALRMMTEMALGNLSSAIANKQRELIAFKEEGKSAEEVKAQSELNELQMKKRAAEDAKARMESEEQAAQRANAGTKATANPLTERWLGRNKWFTDKRFATNAAMVRAIDAQMAREGYRPSSEDFFIELDKRIHREMPQLRARIRQGGYGPRPQPQGRPSGGALPVRTGTPAAAPRAGRIVLKKIDLENMERFGMDPNSREHQIQYAKSKMGRE